MSSFYLQKKELFESHLDDYLPPRLLVSDKTAQAVTHSLKAPGKRVRPVLFLTLSESFGLPAQRVIPAALAIEMIHTSSLILDDLPFMDDAVERRGRPCVHLVFGEATAVLAAESLLVDGLELISRNCLTEKLNSRQHHRAIEVIIGAIGLSGMIAGQQADLDAWYGKSVSAREVEKIHRQKTGALFRGLTVLAGILGRVSPKKLRRLEVLGSAFGRAFQIQDDLMDWSEGEKTNIVPVLGEERAQGMLAEALARVSKETTLLHLSDVEEIITEVFGEHALVRGENEL